MREGDNLAALDGDVPLILVVMEKTGIVQAFNVSPKGTLEGLLMKIDGGVIQINFRQEFTTEITSVAAEGKELRVDVEPEEAHGLPNHPVFRLLSLGGHNAPFAGKVKRLNYALHGEANGAILDSGDFLHVKPHGAIALDLKPGMNVKGTGSSKPMFDGNRVIEATEVNGIQMEKRPKSESFSRFYIRVQHSAGGLAGKGPRTRTVLSVPAATEFEYGRPPQVGLRRGLGIDVISERASA
jgi:hypothetical protein